MIRKIIHIGLALLLLVATTGVTLHKHYCKGKVKAIAVFEEADGCFEGMGLKQEDCFSNCCENKEVELKIEDLETKKPSFAFDFTPKVYLSVLSYFLTDIDPLSVSINFILHYNPPLLTLDVPVVMQSFLL